MKPSAQRYTIRKLPACTDWQGNSYPDRFGLTLTLTGNPIRVDGGEFHSREEAIEAGEIACGLHQRCEHDNPSVAGECLSGLCTCDRAHRRASMAREAITI